MNRNITYKLRFLSDWHCGSGLAAGADADMLVVKDSYNLPFVPGKTIKGLLREAAEIMADDKATTEIDELFGNETTVCQMFFSNAELDQADHQVLIATNTQEFLFRNLANIRINDKGTTEKGSLRKIQVTIPCELVGEIQNVPSDKVQIIKDGLRYIKRLGQGRSRGLGRCQFVEIIDMPSEVMNTEKKTIPNRTVQFKCELLSDVILNQKAATEGPNQTLDYIPGSNFLGIIAKEYSNYGNDAWTVFHSGQVRFGDAHPSIGKMRGLKVPASMYYPKLSSPDQECFIHHKISPDQKKKLQNIQLKQCRSGFYDFSTTRPTPITTETNFAIKSAYNSEKRTSEDGQMYGYQSLQKGLVMYFSVEFDSDVPSELMARITSSLKGKHSLGRSRTAQYGLVNIDEFEYNEVTSNKSFEMNYEEKHSQFVAVYADSRLIFLNKQTCQPTFHPEVDQLLGEGVTGEIMTELSQIRTFRYAPYNQKRHCFDNDRIGIEKGSVIVVRVANPINLQSQYVGSYNNEGFGHVIYNPAFLNSDQDGVAEYHLQKKERVQYPEELYLVQYFNDQHVSPSEFLRSIARRQSEVWDTEDIDIKTNLWIGQHKDQFKSGQNNFASQWSTIRSIVMRCQTYEEIRKKLFVSDESYLRHGLCRDKWEDRHRLSDFRYYVDSLADKDDLFAKRAIITLASEMAKECRKEK